MRLAARLGVVLRRPEKGEDPVDLLGALVMEEEGLKGWIILWVRMLEADVIFSLLSPCPSMRSNKPVRKETMLSFLNSSIGVSGRALLGKLELWEGLNEEGTVAMQGKERLGETLTRCFSLLCLTKFAFVEKFLPHLQE